MPNQCALRIIGAISVLSLSGLALPVQAAYQQVGFQWVAPTDAPVDSLQQPSYAPVPAPSSLMPVMRAAPSSSTAPEIISPIVITGQPTPSVSVQPDVSQVNTNAEVISSSIGGGSAAAPAPAMAPVTNADSIPPISASDDIVHGFAKQVPLAVALRQILPPGYGFSVDQNIDLGTLVSFSGGKPWRDTLRIALQPAHLTTHEQGQMVTISRGEDRMAMTSTDTLSGMAPVVIPSQPTTSKPIASLQPHTLQPPVGSDFVVIPAQDTVSPSVVQSWHAERGDTLHKILEEWSRHANVEFEWISEYDYPLHASVNFSGTFEDAVRNVLTGFETAHPQPVAELHANANLGQMVLIVGMRGNNYSE